MLTSKPADVEAASHVILPGVGAFPEAMANLERAGLVEALQRHVIERGAPFLGICLGMQLMTTRGLEGRPTAGLGWIDGEVRRLEGRPTARVPHVGWNEVHLARTSRLFDGVRPQADFYFVHSFVMQPADARDVLAATPHGEATFASAVQRGNLAGVQFHPEKSQRAGLQVLRNFVRDGVIA